MVDAICAAVTVGVPPIPAAARMGVPKSTLLMWVRRGVQARYDRDERGVPVPPPEEKYVSFLDRFERAQGTFFGAQVATIQSAAKGGQVISRTTRKLPDGTVETEEKRSAPDWRAAAYLLDKAGFARIAAAPVTPEEAPTGGGELVVSDVVGGLAQRIAAAREAETADTVDAEIVDEP